MKIEIYGKTNCGNCTGAKSLLDAKGIGYTYQDFFELSDEAQNTIRTREPSARTFPMIFIDDTFVGGFDNLKSVFK